MPAKHAKGPEREAGDDAPRRKWTIRRAGGARPNREHAAGQYRPACVALDKVTQESRPKSVHKEEGVKWMEGGWEARARRACYLKAVAWVGRGKISQTLRMR